MRRQSKTPWPLVVAAMAGLAAAPACDRDAVVDVTGETPILRVLVTPATESVLPRGTTALGSVRISNFNFTTPDGFNRATGALGNYKTIPHSCSGCGPGTGFDVAGAARNSSQDGRLPALVTSTATAGAFWGLLNPAWTGVGAGNWNLWGAINGLKANTTYTVVLARMALAVRGELDQNQRLTGASIAQADSLYFLGGTPYAPTTAVTCNFTAIVGVNTSRNPVALGTFTTSATGAGSPDCVIGATGDSPWWRSAASQTPPGAADSLPVGTNGVGGRVLPGQYNYVLIYEGAYTPGGSPTPSAAPTVRAQIGPDIDANGNAINNAFAPFPTAMVNLATYRTLPGGANAFAAPGTITMNLSGLPSLGSSAHYAVWLHDRAGNAYTRVNGNITVGTQTARGTQITSPGDTTSIRFVIDDASNVDLGKFHSVVVSMETGTSGTAPSASKFLYSTYLTTALGLEQGAMAIGTFHPQSPKVFAIGGTGRGNFFRDSLIVNLNRLNRPPEGFQYASYVSRTSGGAVQAQKRLGVVTLDAFGDGSDRIPESAVGSFSDYNGYVVLLEPAGSTMPTRIRVQESQNWVDKFPSVFKK